MKLKEGFMLRNIAGSWVVVPLGQRVVDFNGIITLNETGAFLWNQILNGKNSDEMVDAVTAEYDVSLETAKKDVEEFILSLKNHQILDKNT